MKMLDIILSSIAIVVIGFMFYFTYMYLREKIEKVGRKPVSFKDEARYNKMLDKIMFDMYSQLHASNVFLARLHNNGYWNNGRSMKKFTIMLEKFSPTSLSIQQEYKDFLCSRYAIAMDNLFFYHGYEEPDMSLCKDANIKRDFVDKYGYKSVYFFIIEQANGDKTEEAFIGVLFKEQTLLKRDQIEYIKSKRFDILGLLNMVEPTHAINV